MKTFSNSTTYKNIKYECVQHITTDAYLAYYYALHVLKQRWADVDRQVVEDMIAMDTYRAYSYARDVLKRRWADVGRPEVEDLITKDPHSACLYSWYVINKRWADVGRQDVEDMLKTVESYWKFYDNGFRV